MLQLEGIVSICISIALTAYLYESTEEINFDGHALDWVLLSFAVITPISATINMSFQRRERALVEIASFRASCLAFYQSHAMWGWTWKNGSTGRPVEVNSLDHADQVMAKILNISI